MKTYQIAITLQSGSRVYLMIDPVDAAVIWTSVDSLATYFTECRMKTHVEHIKDRSIDLPVNRKDLIILEVTKTPIESFSF